MDEQPEQAHDQGAPDEPPQERRYPSTIGGAAYLAILLTTLVGLVIAALGSWRPGIQVVAAALVVGAVLRLTLPQRDAGMLAVRHRLVDAVLLAGTAGALFFLTTTIPNQPT
ncbi:MAG: DUF3017 domain-containing protein [Nocardioides sp.]|nr:DUF3017 domain-containing protein [Nocardioides sp.]